MFVTTLIETRLAITLLRADKIPAIIGINICFKPKTCSVWASDSSLSSHGIFKLSLQITTVCEKIKKDERLHKQQKRIHVANKQKI